MQPPPPPSFSNKNVLPQNNLCGDTVQIHCEQLAPTLHDTCSLQQDIRGNIQWRYKTDLQSNPSATQYWYQLCDGWSFISRRCVHVDLSVCTTESTDCPLSLSGNFNSNHSSTTSLHTMKHKEPIPAVYVLLFFSTGFKFSNFIITHSYSSCPFLCALVQDCHVIKSPTTK